MNDTATLEFRSGVTKVVDAAMTELSDLFAA